MKVVDQNDKHNGGLDKGSLLVHTKQLGHLQLQHETDCKQEQHWEYVMYDTVVVEVEGSNPLHHHTDLHKLHQTVAV